MNLLQRHEAEKQAAFDVGQCVGRQQVIDMVQLALQKRGYGEKRLWEILMDMKALYDEFWPAFDVKHPECDCYRERLDRCLSQNCGKEHPLVPFKERYEYLKQVNYGGRRRK